MNWRMWFIVLLAASLVGCGTSGTPNNTGDSSNNDVNATSAYEALGEYASSADSLTFDLPGDFDAYVYVPPVGRSAARQGGSEQLLALASLTGAQGPEVIAGETTRVPLRFDLQGQGSVTITGWRVEVRHQETGDSQDQTKTIDPTSRKALILFAGLPTGRYDATVEMYGTSDATQSGATGNLLFDLTVERDPEGD